MTDWKETTLGDVAEILSAKRVFARDYVDNGVPFWRGKEVVELSAGRDVSTELFISEETYQNLGRKAGFPSAGDILLTSVGTLGRVYRLTPKDRIYFKDGNLTWFRNFDECICPQWLLYWLRSNAGQRALDSSKIGSTQQALTIVNLKKIPFLCPPKSEQEKIAATLSSLDEKIELNRRMNETLEEMARALFRDWFVDFGPTRRQMDGATDPAAIMGHAFPPEKAATLPPLFPAKLGDDGLPEGWAKGTLQDFGTVRNGFAFKSKDWRDEGVPVIKIKNVKPRLVSLEGAGFIDPELAAEKKRFRLGAGDILVGMTGYVGEVGRVPYIDPLPMLNQRVGHIVAEYREGFSPFLFACTRQQEFKEHAVARSHGSAQANVSAKDLGLFSVAKPCSETVGAFDEVAAPLFERMEVADTENQTLAEMRDLLLPKLMSGEIRLKDAEAEV